MTADIEVVVFVHDEGHFLGGCITSVMRAAAYAESKGRSVILMAVVRAPTPLTTEWVRQRMGTPWQILNFPDSTLSQARNMARLAVTGRNVAFIDGYDLWCETWLDRAIDAASRESAVWRPEVLITFGNDFHAPAGYSTIFQPLRIDFPAVLLSRQTVASGFVAPRDVVLAHPWPDADPERGWDTPDHWWNCNVAAAGHMHRAIPETFHYRRLPEANLAVPSVLRDTPKIRTGPTPLARCAPTKTPLLSFIVLSYNYQDYIRTTIRSILDQTVQDFEIVVVDDASTDASREVVRDFGDSRIRLLVNERNLGGAGSYNVAVQAARGEWLVNLDADDWIAPEKSERQLAFAAANPDLDIIGTYLNVVDAEGNRHADADLIEDMYNKPHAVERLDTWFHCNPLARSSSMVRRSAHLRIGLDDPAMVRAPDYELWTRALRLGCRFGMVPEKLTYLRLQPRGVTHGDPLGSLLELAYARLRNLMPLLESHAQHPSFQQMVNWLITEPNLGALPPVQQHRLVGLLMAPPPDGDYPAFRAYLADAQRDPRLGTMGRRMLAYGMETQETTNRLYRDLGAIDGAKNHWHGQAERAEADASRWRVQAEELRAELAHLRGQTIVPEARFSRMRTSWVYRQVAKVYSRYYRS